MFIADIDEVNGRTSKDVLVKEFGPVRNNNINKDPC